MGNKSVECIVKTDKPFYCNGQDVTGAVYINAPKEYPCCKIILHVQGSQRSWWKGQATVDNRVKKTSNESQALNKLIQANFILCQWNDKSFLHGQYVFPFIFKLPSHLPGTFNQKKSDYLGDINYQIKVRCVSPNSSFKHIEAGQQLVLRQTQKTFNQTMYGQLFVYPTSCFRKKGVSKISCYFDKNNYIRGQNSVIICQADNYKCKKSIKEVKCEFIKCVTLTGLSGQTKIIKQKISETNFPGVKAEHAYVGVQAERRVVELKPKSKDKLINPSTSGRLVSCQYYMQVYPVFQSCCCCQGKPEFFCVKVFILHQGLPPLIVQQPVNWNPQVYHRSQIFLNYGGSNPKFDEMQSADLFF